MRILLLVLVLNMGCKAYEIPHTEQVQEIENKDNEIAVFMAVFITLTFIGFNQ